MKLRIRMEFYEASCARAGMNINHPEILFVNGTEKETSTIAGKEGQRKSGYFTNARKINGAFGDAGNYSVVSAAKNGER